MTGGFLVDEEINQFHTELHADAWATNYRHSVDDILETTARIDEIPVGRLVSTRPPMGGAG